MKKKPYKQNKHRKLKDLPHRIWLKLLSLIYVPTKEEHKFMNRVRLLENSRYVYEMESINSWLEKYADKEPDYIH